MTNMSLLLYYKLHTYSLYSYSFVRVPGVVCRFLWKWNYWVQINNRIFFFIIDVLITCVRLQCINPNSKFYQFLKKSKDHADGGIQTRTSGVVVRRLNESHTSAMSVHLVLYCHILLALLLYYFHINIKSIEHLRWKKRRRGRWRRRWRNKSVVS